LNTLYVPLELDSVGKNIFQVEVKPSGKPKDNYKIISIISTPEEIQLEGTDSLLKTVGTIKVNVDVTNLDRDKESKLKCIIVDKKNKDITKSFIKTPSVNIKINVAKEVVVKPIIAGIPAPSFLNVSNVSDPKTVLISGPYEIISKIKQIETVPISIENQNENVIITSELVLPEGVTLVDSPQEVNVSLAIEPLAQKTLDFSPEDIVVLNQEIDNSLKYDILTPNLSIEIKGPRYELDKLNLGIIVPSIDVSKLIEGVSRVPLKFTLPGTVRLVKDYDVEVSIVKR
jgi:YbbR domain-containing protein